MRRVRRVRRVRLAGVSVTGAHVNRVKAPAAAGQPQATRPLQSPPFSKAALFSRDGACGKILERENRLVFREQMMGPQRV